MMTHSVDRKKVEMRVELLSADFWGSVMKAVTCTFIG